MELYFFHPKARFPLDPELLETTIQQREAPTVVLCDGAVAGFADLYGSTPGEVSRIGNVIVSSEFRGRGVASHLIRQMIDIAAQTYAARRVELACFNNNTAGLLLYPKLGFRPYAIAPRTGPSGERLALIQLGLDLI